jgi:hypothetical protein
MEKLNINNIRGKWNDISYFNGDPTQPIQCSGDDTEDSLRIIAEKVNEIVEHINSNIEEQDYD